MASEAQSPTLALRIDDIGASSKRHLYHTRRWYSNLGPLRDRRLFGHWAPYREMSADDWKQLFKVLERFRSKLTVGITAAWVEEDGTLVPFPKKFPDEAQAIREGLDAGYLEIANHGLTHCVLRENLFRRKFLFGSNQPYHREFWEWIHADLQLEHLATAQKILTDYYQTEITTFIPPGNVYSLQTIAACKQLGIRTLNCQRPTIGLGDTLRIIGNENVLAFHDREIVLFGTRWLEAKLRELPRPPQRFVRELG